MFLSILVPVYNVEPHIRQCLDSLLSQTFTDFELILVDDCSTDKSGDVCDEYAALDSRVIVIHKKKNEGIVRARKSALSIARGDYIGIVDSDDWVEKDMFARLCGKAEKYDADMVICGFFYRKGKTVKTVRGAVNHGFFDKERLQREIYPHMLSYGSFFHFGIKPVLWNKIYKRELIMEYMNVSDFVTVGEDASAVYPCLLRAERVFIFERGYRYHYRYLENSMTREYKQWYFNSNRSVFSCLAKVMVGPELRRQLDEYIIYMSYNAMINEVSDLNERKYVERLAGMVMYLADPMVRAAYENVDVKRLPIYMRIIVRLVKGKCYMSLLCLLYIYKFILKVKWSAKKLKKDEIIEFDKG